MYHESDWSKTEYYIPDTTNQLLTSLGLSFFERNIFKIGYAPSPDPDLDAIENAERNAEFFNEVDEILEAIETCMSKMWAKTPALRGQWLNGSKMLPPRKHIQLKNGRRIVREPSDCIINEPATLKTAIIYGCREDLKSVLRHFEGFIG